MAKILVEPISALKRAAEIVDQVRQHRSPVIITQNGRAAVVIQDVETYEAREQAFALLKLCLDGERGIEEGRAKSLSEFRRSRRQRVRHLVASVTNDEEP